MVLLLLIYGDVMKIQNLIETIYPEVGEDIILPTPKTNLSYHMLSHNQLIDLANKSLDILVATRIDQVLVSEAGAVPFAKICAWLGHKRGLALQWYSLKIPRNINDCLSVTLSAFLKLSKEQLALSSDFNSEILSVDFNERYVLEGLPKEYFFLKERSLNEVLTAIQEDLNFSLDDSFVNLTQKSGLAQILTQPFIFFDEYLDSGTTLFQTFRFLKLFVRPLSFKLFCYLIKLPQDQLNTNLCQSLYTLDNEAEAYNWGIYPFENRIDWLGYFYRIQSQNYSKVTFTQLLDSHEEKKELPEELLYLYELCSNDERLEELKRTCVVPAVASYINKKHFIQYSLYLLEKNFKKNSKESEFLYQLFDMYGPIWTPLPDAYHLSYLQAFEKIGPKIMEALSVTMASVIYKTHRSSIIHAIASLIETRRKHYQYSLLTHLEQQ